ncbi:tyrosine-type recombinase/integrase [Nocardioides sp. URHA0032]|uniref:tyrosine-type recombinase/integrase n=1 Tax=Nocardioides sp. URHA0032 TaxID=1380388 RepID=UPI0012DC9F92|nr:tyrosine-type recombinase/integrase [Nocardioides sp. URHA0032]
MTNRSERLAGNDDPASTPRRSVVPSPARAKARDRLRAVASAHATAGDGPGGGDLSSTGTDVPRLVGPPGGADSPRSAAVRMFARAASPAGASHSVGAPDGFNPVQSKPGAGAGVPAAARPNDAAEPADLADLADRDGDVLDQLRREFAEHSLATQTRRNYAGHQRAWENWCRDREIAPGEATPQDVARHLTGYLIECDESGQVLRDEEGNPVASVATSTLALRLAAIDKAFERTGRDRPGQHLVVRELMEGIRRLYGVAPVHAKGPLLLADLRLIVAGVRREQAQSVRDRVMAEARRQLRATPGQLARLDWADVEIGDVDAYLVLAPERRGGPRRRARLRAATVPTRCPVAALRDLRDLAGATGPVLTGPAGEALTRQAIDKRLRVLARRPAGDVAPTPRPSNKSLRDAALLTCGWFAALRRSNIVALRWSDLTWYPGGEIRVRLRRSKTDQQGTGKWNWLPRLDGDSACPATALTEWRNRVAELVGGDPAAVCPDAPVFAAMNRHDQFKMKEGSMRRLRGEAVNDLIQQLVVRTGLVTGDRQGRNPFGGHSLRSGFVTQACLNRVPLIEIAQVTHHADPRSLVTYNKPNDRSSMDTLRDVARAV